MKKLVFWLILPAIISCEIGNNSENRLEILTHENGLTISVDKSAGSVAPIAGGFKISLSEQDARAVNEIEVIISSVSPENLEQFATKDIHGIKYFYKLESFSEGSGGEEYTLKVWKPGQDGGILLEHYTQQELEPDFDMSWAIIEQARLTDAGTR